MSRITILELGYDEATSDMLWTSENTLSKPSLWINSVALSSIIIDSDFSLKVRLMASSISEVWLTEMTKSPSSEVEIGSCDDEDRTNIVAPEFRPR